jgi:hypothetical protein
MIGQWLEEGRWGKRVGRRRRGFWVEYDANMIATVHQSH